MRVFCTFLFAVLLFAAGALPVAADSYFKGSFYDVRYVDCYDGDTCTFLIPYVAPVFGENIPVRLAGLDTPEMKGACPYEITVAVQARDFIRQKLSKALYVDLHRIARDKYFRLVAEIWADGENLNKLILATNHAVPYDGKTKLKDWCKVL